MDHGQHWYNTKENTMHPELNTVNHVLDFETFDAVITAERNMPEIYVQNELSNLHVILLS